MIVDCFISVFGMRFTLYDFCTGVLRISQFMVLFFQCHGSHLSICLVHSNLFLVVHLF